MRVLYDTTWSTRGVLQAVGRKPRGKDPFDFQVCLPAGCLWWSGETQKRFTILLHSTEVVQILKENIQLLGSP